MNFTQFYAETSLQNDPQLQSLLSRYPELQWIDDYQKFKGETMHREKRCVVFAKKRGPWLKPFHCYSHNHQYRYLSLDLAEGCAFDCVYCYLQTYLNHGALVVFVNTDSLQTELLGSGKNAWISTGLLTDSLLAEAIFPVVPSLSKLVPEGSILELRTKSSNVACMEPREIERKNVVLSWSVNPQTIAQQYEYGAANLQQRLVAAERALDLGYRVAFHLDPVFHFEGWETEYERLVRRLLEFPTERVAFVSLGLFRYMTDLGNIIRKRFPYHDILTGEFFPDEDGKYHYLRGIRREMHHAFRQWLAPWDDVVPVFWSMEPDAAILSTQKL